MVSTELERWGKRSDMIVHQADPFNAETSRSALAAGPLTETDAFYCRNHGPIPDIDPLEWRLKVDGLVTTPIELTLAQLQALPRHELIATLQCAGNRRSGLLEVEDIPGEAPWGPGATSTASWAGARLRDVLDAAGLNDDATHIGFTAPDISDIAEPPEMYGSSIARAKALADETLLAWEMNDEALPRIHGGPVRVVVPGYIGARSVKWIERITGLDHPSPNYFQSVAYRLLPPDTDPAEAGPDDGFQLGAIAVNCDITYIDSTHATSGYITVGGYALAGDDREITRVDISTDDGIKWIQASLTPSLGPWAWRTWTATVHVQSDTTHIVARAWDSTAAVQPEHARHVWNPKGYVNNSWARINLAVPSRAVDGPTSSSKPSGTTC